MSKRRVVVTGLGMVSPLGHSVAQTWENILAGQSGVKSIDEFDASAFTTRIWASITGLDVNAYIPVKEARKMDKFTQFGMIAADEAVKDSGLEVTEANAPRLGVAVGSGIGGLETINRNHDALNQHGPRKVSPFFIPAGIINMVAGQISIKHGFKGPNISIVTACTTGTHNIGSAARMIEYGDADVMLAGGAEMATTPLCLAGFAAARALSKRNDDPTRASRPWDKDRDGFVLGEGAGVVVLEEYEHAKARGAKIYGEIAGYGMSGDAYHITSPDESGAGARQCMQIAMDDAKINPTTIDYINAHGTSTYLNDKNENRSVKTLFGDHAYQLAMSSTKSMTGHLLGAAGAVEAIFSLLAIRDNVAPPTINLDNPDENCDLNYVPHEPQQREINAVMSNSFGFGGTNASLVMTRV